MVIARRISIAISMTIRGIGFPKARQSTSALYEPVRSAKLMFACDRAAAA